ncbi:MAG: type II toxin-antitoxin system VapC family toxin [Thermodesulfobacteriota bacterium]
MADQYQNPYLDSSVFIAWIKGEVVNGVDRKDIADHILGIAQKGSFKINISAFTLAEVHKKKGAESPKLEPDEDELILAYFEHDFFNIIDVTRDIGEHANRLCRQYSLLPADAIHLACALRAKCDVLLAWDDRLTAVDHPEIRTENPRKIGQLNLLENIPEETA